MPLAAYGRSLCAPIQGMVDGYCDAIIIMPSTVMDRYRQSHEWFYCYLGHTQHFPQESPQEKLVRQRNEAERKAANATKREEWAKNDLKHEKNRSRALKGVVTRTKNRVKNGLCPCCNRTFTNLAKHMPGQHPEYGAPKE